MKNLFNLCFKWSILVSTLFIQFYSVGQVKVYQGTESIPTYKLGDPIESPIFYTGRGVQGAAGHMYPYPAQTNLSEVLTNEVYEFIYLENEFLKVSILPEFGGRLFSAIDKTNGHELFHINTVIKPDLIGSLGAWISGGIEWCFPHHHRTTTLMPADYTIEENEDGSATVWIGETERDQQLRAIVGITLYPGKSYIEATYRINNTTDVTKNFLFWANVAITANEDFRTFWPPSQEIGVFHGNRSFTHWPISREVYSGTDYTQGVDLTWWKNHPDPVSFFMWQAQEGFIGGYDYGAKAGTIHVGNIHKNATSKLWQFGPGLQGQNARRKLTDDGKAYVELMTGTFSNNQPDYGWIAPHSVKDAVNYWYPIRDLEVVKNANLDASVSLQMRDEKNIFYGFNTTGTFKNAKAILLNGDKILDSNTLDISPSRPFTATYKSKIKVDKYQLKAMLIADNEDTLISYRPYELQNPELPPTQEPLGSPEEIESVEDLYLAGRFVEQFSRPGLNADDYFLAGLKKSPNDYRINIAMGIRKVKELKFEEALTYFQKASDKLKVNYMQPAEGELFYYTGIANKGLGNRDAAYKNFYRATWYYEWSSAAYYELSLIESKKGNWNKALEFAEYAYNTNNNDTRINLLMAGLFRKLGQREEALTKLSELLDFDPLYFQARYEQELLGEGNLSDWRNQMQDVDNNYLEIATTYVNAGWYEDGLRLLESLEKPGNPLITYYQSWFMEQLGRDSDMELAKAGEMSPVYCFPYRKETLEVLSWAVLKDSANDQAHYLIGNLLYDKQPELAIHHWEKAAEINNHFPMVLRNIAFGAFHYEKNVDKAINYLTKAIKADPNQPIWYAELADYYELSDKDKNQVLALMEANKEVVLEDINAPKSMVKLYNLNQEYEKAIDLLNQHHFRTWEGGRTIYYHYVDAHVLKAIAHMENNEHNKAINELMVAMEYPENLEVGKPLNDERNAMIYYLIGKNYEAMDNKKEARSSYEKSVKSVNSRAWKDLIYYQAKSHEAMGQQDEATELYQQLINTGKEIKEKGLSASGIGVDEGASQSKSMAEAYYLQALGYRGLNERQKADDLLEKSLDKYGNSLWSNIYQNIEL